MKLKKWPITIAIILLAIISIYSQNNEKVEIAPGTEFQGEIGQFADPTTLHGTTISMNGSLGASSKTKTFGYDVFNISARVVPGSTGFGNRIAIQFGASNWFTPALKSVYTDSALTINEKSLESNSVNSIMVGFGIRFFKSRIPTDEDWAPYIDTLRKLDLAVFNAETKLEKEKLREIQTSYKWAKIQRPAYRKPSAMMGAMFRLGALGFESDVEVTDFYLSGAIGKKLFDFMCSVHYLLPLSDELISKNVFTGTLGFFYDLDEKPVFEPDKSPQIRTLGLTFAIGKYNYNEKTLNYLNQNGETYIYSNNPSTLRFDVNLSINGLFGSIGPFGSGIGIKYSRLLHSSASYENQFQIQFTSKLISQKK